MDVTLFLSFPNSEKHNKKHHQNARLEDFSQTKAHIHTGANLLSVKQRKRAKIIVGQREEKKVKKKKIDKCVDMF